MLPAQIFATPSMMGGPGYVNLKTDSGRRACGQLDLLMAGLAPEVVAVGTNLDGSPGRRLAMRSNPLDLLVPARLRRDARRARSGRQRARHARGSVPSDRRTAWR
jgi:hypothetical protein